MGEEVGKGGLGQVVRVIKAMWKVAFTQKIVF